MLDLTLLDVMCVKTNIMISKNEDHSMVVKPIIKSIGSDTNFNLLEG